jgi:pseudouridine-5'-phosphate glycosidase
VASILATRFSLGQGGVVVCNPIPEGAALDAHVVDDIVAEALARAASEGVRGKALTPYLLAELERRSGGATLRANRSLAVANARLGAEVAAAYAAITA